MKCASFRVPSSHHSMTLMWRRPRHPIGIQYSARDVPRWDNASPCVAQAPTEPGRSHVPREHRGVRPSLLRRSSKTTSRSPRGRNWAHHQPRHPKRGPARRVGRGRERPGARLEAELVPHRPEAPQRRRADHLVRFSIGFFFVLVRIVQCHFRVVLPSPPPSSYFIRLPSTCLTDPGITPFSSACSQSSVP
jgi:hypothetical protein